MPQTDVVPESAHEAEAVQDAHVAWRDLVIRMQTRLDGAEGANAAYLVDFTLAAL
jgi:hypothetical protein